jgi:hypothetical protein
MSSNSGSDVRGSASEATAFANPAIEISRSEIILAIPPENTLTYVPGFRVRYA